MLALLDSINGRGAGERIEIYVAEQDPGKPTGDAGTSNEAGAAGTTGAGQPPFPDEEPDARDDVSVSGNGPMAGRRNVIRWSHQPIRNARASKED
jgi:hypothetical protein